MVPRKMVPEKNGPRKNDPREKWSPENWSAEKWSPENWSPEKFSSKIFLRQKNAKKFKRLFYFYQLIPLYTHKNVWRLCHDPTYVPNCRTLKESRKICCRVLGFHRWITSEHSTHTHHDAQRSPHDFLFPVLALFPSFVFVVEFWVFIDWSHPNIPHTHTAMLDAHPTIFRFWVSRRPIFRGPFFPVASFPGTIFPGFLWTVN